MSTQEILTHNSIESNSTHPANGPAYNPSIQEYEVYLDSQIIGYASTQSQAYATYHEALATRKEHIQRNPENGSCHETTSHDKLETGDIPANPQNSLIPSEDGQQFTRRQLLSIFVKAALTAPLAALVTLPDIGSIAEFFTGPAALSTAQQQPYPDPDRTATIDAWRDRLDRVIVSLQALSMFLTEARALEPGQVDGTRLIDLNHAIRDEMDDLTGTLNTQQWSDLVLATTGQREWHLCIKNAIVNKEGDRRAWQAELAAIGEDYPPSAIAELRSLLDVYLPEVV